jgi:hypothetical protein
LEIYSPSSAAFLMVTVALLHKRPGLRLRGARPPPDRLL